MPTETIVISHSLHLIYTFWRLREPPLYEVLWEDSWRVHWTVNPKGNQHWIFIGRTDAEVETPIFWLPDAKNWLIGKDPDAGKDWRREEKGTTDEMVGRHHWLNGHVFEQAPGDNELPGSLAYWSPWGGKELDTTKRLNINVYPWAFVFCLFSIVWF